MPCVSQSVIIRKNDGNPHHIYRVQTLAASSTMSELIRRTSSHAASPEKEFSSKRAKTSEEVSDKSSDAADAVSENTSSGADDRLQRMSAAIRTVIEVSCTSTTCLFI